MPDDLTTALSEFLYNVLAEVRFLVGNGSPEGVETADIGSVFLRLDGGSGTTLYVKESGSGNTGWAAKGAGGGGAWGDITGTLADQTDLQTALDAKQDASAITYARKTADQNITSTTLVDVTSLTASVVAGTYVIEVVAFTSTFGSTTAIFLTLNGPGTSALDFAVKVPTSGTARQMSKHTAFEDTTGQSSNGSGATVVMSEIVGTAVFTEAGTLAVRAAAEANDVDVHAGSYLRLTKIA